VLGKAKYKWEVAQYHRGCC